MAIFSIPEEIDEFFTLLFFIIFLVGFMINVYSNGNATIVYFNEEYSLDTYDDLLVSNHRMEMIQKYASNVLDKSRKALWISLFLYWLGIPIVCFYYGIFKFRKVFKPIVRKHGRVNSKWQ